MTGCVLDASVAAKWFLPRETLAEEALRLLRRHSAGELRVIVPDLFWTELGNVLWKAVRTGRISERAAGEAIETVTATEFPTTPTSELLKNAFAIAITFQVTVYDAAYAALAADSGWPLVTADERLVRALGTLLPVRYLAVAD